MQAFVPDPLIAAGYVYSGEHRRLMLWQNERDLGGYCMDTKTEFFKTQRGFSPMTQGRTH